MFGLVAMDFFARYSALRKYSWRFASDFCLLPSLLYRKLALVSYSTFEESDFINCWKITSDYSNFDSPSSFIACLYMSSCDCAMVTDALKKRKRESRVFSV